MPLRVPSAQPWGWRLGTPSVPGSNSPSRADGVEEWGLCSGPELTIFATLRMTTAQRNRKVCLPSHLHAYACCTACFISSPSSPQLPRPQADAENPSPSPHLRAGPCWGPGDPPLIPLCSRCLSIHQLGEIASISAILPPQTPVFMPTGQTCNSRYSLTHGSHSSSEFRALGTHQNLCRQRLPVQWSPSLSPVSPL